jgi:hypothetical protein
MILPCSGRPRDHQLHNDYHRQRHITCSSGCVIASQRHPLCIEASTPDEASTPTWQFIELSLRSGVWQRPEQLADWAVDGCKGIFAAPHDQQRALDGGHQLVWRRSGRPCALGEFHNMQLTGLSSAGMCTGCTTHKMQLRASVAHSVLWQRQQ